MQDLYGNVLSIIILKLGILNAVRNPVQNTLFIQNQTSQGHFILAAKFQDNHIRIKYEQKAHTLWSLTPSLHWHATCQTWCLKWWQEKKRNYIVPKKKKPEVWNSFIIQHWLKYNICKWGRVCRFLSKYMAISRCLVWDGWRVQ